MNWECKKVLIETILMADIIQKTKLSLDHEEEEMLLKHAEETKDFDVNVVLSLDQKVSDQQVCPLAQFFFSWLLVKKINRSSSLSTLLSGLGPMKGFFC